MLRIRRAYAVVITIFAAALLGAPVASAGDLSVTARVFATYEGLAESTWVATLYEPASPGPTCRPASDFGYRVDWGDGTSESGGARAASGGDGIADPRVEGSKCAYNIFASQNHSYAEEGNQTMTVTVTDQSDPTNNASNSSTILVLDASLADAGSGLRQVGRLTGRTIHMQHNAHGKQIVARFTDLDPAGTATDYFGSIGLQLPGPPQHAGLITAYLDGVFGLQISFAPGRIADTSYVGTYELPVTVYDQGGASASTTDRVVIDPSRSDKRNGALVTNTSVPVSAGNALAHVTCPFTVYQVCNGSLTLSASQLTTTSSSHTHKNVLGKASFSIASGTHQKISVPLTKSARNKLASKGSLNAIAKLVTRDGHGHKHVTKFLVRLKRHK